MVWSIEFLDERVTDEVRAQPAEIRAKLTRLRYQIEAVGMAALRGGVTKHIVEDIWEIRISGRNTIARAFYVTMIGQRLVILRVFTKKTQKTPMQEIEIAKSRRKEVTS